MKVTAKMFGVLCAVGMVFCAACDNMENGGDGQDGSNPAGGGSGNPDQGESDKEQYAVGNTIGDGSYLVVKNTKTAGMVAVASAECGYYPNARADAYRDYLLEKHEVETPYVIVFNTKTTKDKTATTFDDEYLILRDDGTKLYRIRYRWEDSQVCPQDKTQFAAKTADELRTKYDPSCFNVDIYSAVYGSDLSKKFFRQFRFSYDPDGTMIGYSDGHWRQTDDYKDYVYLPAIGKDRNQYAITDRISDHSRSYVLRNPNDTSTGNGNTFFEFRVYSEEDDATPSGRYRLIANGDGSVKGGTDNKAYQKILYVENLRYYTYNKYPDVYLRVETKKNGSAVGKDYFYGLYEEPYYESEKPLVPEIPSTGGNDSGFGDNDGEAGGNIEQGAGTEIGGQVNPYLSGLVRGEVAATGSGVRNEGVGQYVDVSETETTVAGIRVPAAITLSVPFESADAAMGKFAQVTLEPEAYNDGKGELCVIYVPRKGEQNPYEFIDNFKKGYDIFGEYVKEHPAP
ncbi:MAG: hypothetical protein HDR38_00965 [Treponema sp.]|nr:hypothetical protein [Treponema sp.]